MRFMIIGGVSDTDSDISKLSYYCKIIGNNLAELHHAIIICSPFSDSADYWVLDGYAHCDQRKNPKIEFNFVDMPAIRTEIKKIQSKFPTSEFSNMPYPPPISDTKNLSYAWLLCQLQSLESCQGIIAIGGKLNGAANMLLLLAESKHKLILPLTLMGGAASQSFFRSRYQIKDKLGERYNYLQDIDKDIDKFKEILNCSKTTALPDGKKQAMNVFISYPRKRPSEADYIENILRRRDIKVFRDESEFGAGHAIPREIIEAIYSANVFIAVWCAEYACSPWCFDEFELVLDRRETGKMDTWIICVDKTRVVPKRARELVNYQATTREEIEGIILHLLNS